MQLPKSKAFNMGMGVAQGFQSGGPVGGVIGGVEATHPDSAFSKGMNLYNQGKGIAGGSGSSNPMAGATNAIGDSTKTPGGSQFAGQDPMGQNGYGLSTMQKRFNTYGVS